jgi:hypothetical protein
MPPPTVLAHQNDPALVLENVGTQREKLIIQTGTIVFDFPGTLEDDFDRVPLIHPVLDLPPGSDGFGMRVRATASAAPSSMLYLPPPAAVAMEGSGLRVSGLVTSTGTATGGEGGQVAVSGIVDLPVTGAGQGTVPILGAGWAVDRTRATRSGTKIQLVVDLAVFGPSSRLFRLAYSLFVTISSGSSSDTLDADPTDHRKVEP